MSNAKEKFLSALNKNKVVVLFIVLSSLTIWASGKPLTFVAGELFTRIGRNGFTVLSLLIPVLAGMGLNFGIVIGAIAAQIAMFWVVYWGMSGVPGLIVTVLMATPLAILFGYLVGKLFNKMKGAEMIAGMVLGYFADGLYQFFFLFVIGAIIPVDPLSNMIISGGVGVKNTIDLAGNLKYSLDALSMLTLIEISFYVLIALTLLRVLFYVTKKEGALDLKSFVPVITAGILFAVSFIPSIEAFLATDRLRLLDALIIVVVCIILYQIYTIVMNRVVHKNPRFNMQRSLMMIGFAILLFGLSYVPVIEEILLYVNIPVTTYVLIALLCFFNNWLLKTRLGQNMRTVGQSRQVANAAGINVDRTRIIAMILSTVLACWGQIIYLQNIGTFSTYGAHTQVGQFAIAALLVGGASVQLAKNKHAIIGVILFHSLFIAAPFAGQELFNNAMLGEYFRVFVAYGVIAMSLAMHAWKVKKKKDDDEVEAEPEKLENVEQV